jgi:hypothetical protein
MVLLLISWHLFWHHLAYVTFLFATATFSILRTRPKQQLIVCEGSIHRGMFYHNMYSSERDFSLLTSAIPGKYRNSISN